MMKQHPLDQASLAAVVGRLLDDGRDLARAELSLVRARVSAWLVAARSVAIFAILAFLLTQLALIALVVGLIAILTHAFGAIWATVIVTGLLLVGAMAAAWLAWVQVRKLLGQGKSA